MFSLVPTAKSCFSGSIIAAETFFLKLGNNKFNEAQHSTVNLTMIMMPGSLHRKLIGILNVVQHSENGFWLEEYCRKRNSVLSNL
jgi:hypothetical protein